MRRATEVKKAVDVPAGVSAKWSRRSGLDRTCQGWVQEGLLRMLNNNLDPEVAERPADLVVYGGKGKAARSWEAYEALLAELERLGNDETLLVQSGKPVAVFRTHPRAPRVLAANSNLVGKWATWEYFDELEDRGLIMYGQMTAGSWAYIGTQGIIQGTYETFAELARQHYGGSLRGKITLTGGLGGMGGAQPLAVTMNDGVAICVEVDEARADRRIQIGYCMEKSHDLHDAWRRAKAAAEAGRPLSIALIGNCAEVLPNMVREGLIPDVVTDQTSAHDELNGYIPRGLSLEAAAELRERNPTEYRQHAWMSMAMHVEAMLEMQRRGAVAFDYGNNLRGQVAAHSGVKDAFKIGGFVPLYIRPQFCEGRGPFRWIALSNNADDIRKTDEAVLKLFPQDESLKRWLTLAREHVPFQGLPARVCWLGYGERDKAALKFNEMVRKGEIGPICITRDHLDSGSVASPYRETEAMKDGSDAIADWPLLNALVNTAAGADMVSFHHGGGVGIGYSLHANMHVVCDGSALADEKIRSVFLTDPGMGVVRHADAGYEKALRVAKERGVRIPMREDK